MKRTSKESTEMTSIEDGNVNGYVRDYDICDASKLKATLKPMFVSLRLVGAVYGDVFQACRLKPNSVQPSVNDLDHDVKQQTLDINQGWRYNLGLCFSILVVVFTLGACAHQVYEAAVARTMMDVMTRVFLLLWVVLCLLQHVICVFVTSHRTKKNPINRFDKLVKAILSVRAASVLRTRSCLRYTLIVVWIYYIINVIVVIVGFYYPGDYDTRTTIRGVFIGKSNLTTTNIDVITYIYTIPIPLMCGSWTIPTCFYISMCLLVSGFFNDLFERASYAILEKKSINLQDLRQEYVRLCNVLSALNDLLSPLGMSMFAIYIPLICLNVNVCIQTFNYDSMINRVAYICWITGNSFTLLVVSICGAQVNHSACRLSEVLYNINAQELDKKSELELMLLLSNVNTNYANLTVGGLVTITKEMILTIFGTIVGYLTILIQFR